MSSRLKCNILDLEAKNGHEDGHAAMSSVSKSAIILDLAQNGHARTRLAMSKMKSVSSYIYFVFNSKKGVDTGVGFVSHVQKYDFVYELDKCS